MFLNLHYLSVKFEKNLKKKIKYIKVNDFILLCFKPSLFFSKIENNTEPSINQLLF